MLVPSRGHLQSGRKPTKKSVTTATRTSKTTNTQKNNFARPARLGTGHYLSPEMGAEDLGLSKVKFSRCPL